MFTTDTTTGTQLVSIVEYRRLMKDTASASGDIELVLTDSLRLIEDFLQRYLVSKARTETCTVRNGVIYPLAYPVSVCSDGMINGGIIEGISADSSDVFVETYTKEITYTGGFTSATLPMTIKVALVKTAYDLLNTNNATSFNAEVASVRLGDVAVNYRTTSAPVRLGILSDSIKDDIVGYKRRDLL